MERINYMSKYMIEELPAIDEKIISRMLKLALSQIELSELEGYGIDYGAPDIEHDLREAIWMKLAREMKLDPNDEDESFQLEIACEKVEAEYLAAFESDWNVAIRKVEKERKALEREYKRKFKAMLKEMA